MSGAKANTFQKLGEAVAAANPGDTVIVKPGVYRESVKITKSGAKGSPIVIKSEIPGRAVISGGRIITDWSECQPGLRKARVPEIVSPDEERKKSRATDAQWAEIWTKNDSPEQGFWLFVNNSPLWRAKTIETITPGSFYIDPSGKTLYWAPRPEETPGAAETELNCLRGLISMKKVSDIQIEGFTFTHNAGWARGYSADIQAEDCREILIKDNHFIWSSGQAVMFLACSDSVIKNNTIEWAGHLGLGLGHICRNITIEGNKVLRCNWRRISYHWDAGGIKTSRGLDCELKGNELAYNYGPGFWSDIEYGADWLIHNNTAHDNNQTGIYIEAGTGAVIESNLCYNNADGIKLTVSSENFLRENTLVNNGVGVNLLWSLSYSGSRGAGAVHGGELRDPINGPGQTSFELLTAGGVPHKRMRQWEFAYLKTRSCSDDMPLCGNILWENLFVNNTKNLLETRNYTALPKNPTEARRAGIVSNFSEHNIFISAEGKNIFHELGPYANIDEWRAATGRDKLSPEQPALKELPSWALKNKDFLETFSNPYGKIESMGLGFVPSVMTQIAKAYFLRSKYIEPFALSGGDVKACFIEMDGARTLAVWSVAAGSGKSVRLKLAQKELEIVNGFLVPRKVKPPDGILDLSVSEAPVYLKGVSGPVSEDNSISLALLPFKSQNAELRGVAQNMAPVPAAVKMTFHAPSGFKIEPAAVEKTAGPNEKITAEITVTPLSSGLAARPFAVWMEAKVGAAPAAVRCAMIKIPCSEAGKLSRLDKDITVDGNPGDWGDLDSFKIGDMKSINSIIGGGCNDKTFHRGDKDFSAEIFAGWTENALFWCVKVTDDVVIPAQGAPYQYDDVELFIDGRSPEAQMDEKLSAGCYQIAVSPGTPGQPPVSMVFAAGKTLPESERNDFPAASARTKDGYIIEGKIPFSEKYFPSGGFKPGRIIRLSLQAADKDIPENNGPEYVFGWSASSEKQAGKRNFENNSAWKNMILDEKKKTVPSENNAMIIIDGRHDKIKLLNAETDSVPRLSYATHLGDEGVMMLFSLEKPMRKENGWTELSFSFTPEKSGRVIMSLCSSSGRVRDDSRPRSRLYFDDITAEGANIKNGDFESEPDPLSGWISAGEKRSKATEEQGAARNGRSCAKVFEQSNLLQWIDVRKGEKVKISVWCKRN